MEYKQTTLMSYPDESISIFLHVDDVGPFNGFAKLVNKARDRGELIIVDGGILIEVVPAQDAT